jgi:hypothetical protein
MQAIILQKEKPSAYHGKQTTEKIRYFPLPGALPAGHTLVLNTALGTLSYLSIGDDGPRLIMEQQFTGNEMNVLLPLLELFPHYCPYEVMFASFYNGNVTDLDVAQSRQRLQRALETGVWEREMKPLRNVLSRTRFKMRTFGIDISSILETGYILRVTSRPKTIGNA